MANRRMFSKDIICSDDFQELSLSARWLYIQFNMFADDDGFIVNPKSVMRSAACSENDFSELVSAGYVILFGSGVIVIRHWKINNQIRKDRYKSTLRIAEFKMLAINEDDSYSLETDNQSVTNGIPTDNQSVTAWVENGKPSEVKCSEGEDSEGKVRIGEVSEVSLPKTSLNEVKDFFNGKAYFISDGQIHNILDYLNSYFLPIEYLSFCESWVRDKYPDIAKNDFERMFYNVVSNPKFADVIADFKNFQKEGGNVSFTEKQDDSEILCDECQSPLTCINGNDWKCENCGQWYFYDRIIKKYCKCGLENPSNRHED